MPKAFLGFLALALAWVGSPPAALSQVGDSDRAVADDSDPPLNISELFAYLEGATIAVLLHEIGHAVIDIYGIPLIADEEDAADQFAAIMLYDLSQSGDGRALAGSYFNFLWTLARQRQRGEDDRLLDIAYIDEHDLAERRAFKVLCNTYAAFALADREVQGIYGPQLEAYENAVRSLGADDGRLATCEYDFARALDSWSLFLGPWQRDPAEQAEILERSLAGLDEDLAEPAFRVTYAASPLDRRIDPEPVGLGLIETLLGRPDYRLMGSERLRYYLPLHLAKLISARFRLPNDAGGGGGSVDIVSRPCSDENAFYQRELRMVVLCHELIDAMADAYIRHRTAEEPDAWWRSRYGEHYGPVAAALVGAWWGEDGEALFLDDHGLFALQGSRDEDIAPRHGYWGLDGQELWLIEVFREGHTCFNPACRPRFAEGGLARHELWSLGRGGIPSGEIRGTFRVPPCKIEEARLEAKRRWDRSDVPDLLIFEDRPCAGKDPAEAISTIEIGGTVFTPAPLAALGRGPDPRENSTFELRQYLRDHPELCDTTDGCLEGCPCDKQ